MKRSFASLMSTTSHLEFGPLTSVRVGPLRRHDRALAVVAHPLRASLQLLQPDPQLPLLPAKAALHLLRSLILLLQLLKKRQKMQNLRRKVHRRRSRLMLGESGETPGRTFMCSCACLKRLRVVFLTESDDSGICSLSCSRQCLS